MPQRFLSQYQYFECSSTLNQYFECSRFLDPSERRNSVSLTFVIYLSNNMLKRVCRIMSYIICNKGLWKLNNSLVVTKVRDRLKMYAGNFM